MIAGAQWRHVNGDELGQEKSEGGCVTGVDHVLNRQEFQRFISQSIPTCDTPSLRHNPSYWYTTRRRDRGLISFLSIPNTPQQAYISCNFWPDSDMEILRTYLYHTHNCNLILPRQEYLE
jgi:hypothetical protein